MKVVINRCYGGFCLSDAAVEECVRRGMTLTPCGADGRVADPKADFFRVHGRPVNTGNNLWPLGPLDAPAFRSHPVVVEVVEALGDAANGEAALLRVIDIPFDTADGWEIEDANDGYEKVVGTYRPEWY